MKYIALLLALCFPLFAIAANAALTPEQETRAKSLFKELRCITCQSQSIADSGAALAGDIRTLVRGQIQAGNTDEEIKNYLRERYGDVILMTPTVRSSTALLWFGPALFLLIGGLMLRRMFRAQNRQAS